MAEGGEFVLSPGVSAAEAEAAPFSRCLLPVDLSKTIAINAQTEAKNTTTNPNIFIILAPGDEVRPFPPRCFISSFLTDLIFMSWTYM
jgi:hypothetical protein